MDSFISLIQNLGFPVAFSAYFIFKLERVIERNTEAFISVKEVMLKCNKNHA